MALQRLLYHHDMWPDSLIGPLAYVHGLMISGEEEPRTVPGLKNIGNTCYAAAVLQALASCTSLVRQLQQSLSRLEGMAPQEPGFAAVLLDCLLRLQPFEAAAGQERSESPAAVLCALRQRVGEGVLPAGEEHDAVEAYELLLGLVSSDLQRAFACTAKLRLEAAGGLAALLRPNRAAPLLATAAPSEPKGSHGGASVQQPGQGGEDGSSLAGEGEPQGGASSCPSCALPSPTNSNGMLLNGMGEDEAQLGPGRAKLCTQQEVQQSGRSCGSPEQPSSECREAESCWLAVDDVLQSWQAMARLPCEGTLASELQCLRCRHRFASQIAPFLALPLSIPLAPGRTPFGHVPAASGAAVEQCLQHYFGFEALQGVACTRCSLQASLDAASVAPLGARLKGVRQALQQRASLVESETYQADVRSAGLEWVVRQGPVAKRHVVARLPAVLCLQLRRAFWAAAGEVKVSGHVRFPLVLRLEGLDLPLLGHGAVLGGGAGAQHGQQQEGEPAGQPAAAGSTTGEGAEEGTQQEGQQGPASLPPYRLRAVVVHYGAAQTGHYVVYRCLDEAQRQWARVSDEVTAGVSTAEVLLAEATALFYERAGGGVG